MLQASLNDKYMGLPALMGADRSDCFRHLVDSHKTHKWMEREALSMGGKEILIKSIAQTMPTYAMMIFKIPINICKGMTVDRCHIAILVG
jgi:hypothetical protein